MARPRTPAPPIHLRSARLLDIEKGELVEPGELLVDGERIVEVAPTSVPDDAVDWRPVVNGADREFLDGFEAPGSGIVTRFIALYRLRASGDALTTTGNRLVDDARWRITGYGRSAANLVGSPTMVASTEIVSGQRRRLVWSFYVVDGRIAAGLIETKLLRARAVLLDREPVAAFVAISASMDDPKDPAEQQLTRFLAANPPLTEYFAMLPR